MEFSRDSKPKPKMSGSKSNHKTENATVVSIPRKCAEVFQCGRGGLMYVCLFCGEDFTKALQLEEHLLEHLVKFATILDTKDHRSNIIKTENRRRDQSEKGTTTVSLEVTRQPEPPESIELNQEDFDAFIKIEPNVTEHIIEEDATIKETWFTERVKCDHCKESFKCQGLKNLHLRHKHNISYAYDCQQCDATFNDEDSFKRHKELHEILNNPACTHCKQIFEFQSDLNEHLLQTKTQIEPTKGPKQPYVCHLCGKSFSHSYSCKNHISGDHKGEFLYCDICPFKSKSRSNLKTHMRVHTKERPYDCDICGKKFVHSYYRNIHRRKHTGEKPFQCNICGLTHYSNRLLNMHIRVKHSNLPKKVYPCTVCNQKCRSAFHLKNHTRAHTGEKPFKCNVCNTSFSTNHVLFQHKKIHESIKAYACKYCGAKFTQSAGRRGHERRVHEEPQG